MLALRNFGILTNLILTLGNLIIQGGLGTHTGCFLWPNICEPHKRGPNQTITLQWKSQAHSGWAMLCRQWREERAPKLKTEIYNQCVDPLLPPHPDLSNPPFILSYLIKCFLSLQDSQPSHQEGCQPQRNSFPVLTGLPGKASGLGEKSSMAISWPDHLLVQSQQSSREQLLRDKFSTHQGSPSPSASGHFYETHEKHEASGSKPGMPGCPGCQDVQDARMPSPGP